MAIRPHKPFRFSGTFVSNYIAYPASPSAGFIPQATVAIFRFKYDSTHSGLIYRYFSGAADSQVLKFHGIYNLTFDPDVQAFQGTIEVRLVNDNEDVQVKQILHAVLVNRDQIKFVLVRSLPPDLEVEALRTPPHPPNAIVQGVMDRVHNPNPWLF